MYVYTILSSILNTCTAKRSEERGGCFQRRLTFVSLSTR